MPPEHSEAHRSSILGAILGAILAVLASPLRFVRWLTEWLTWWTASLQRRITLLLLLTVALLSALATRTSRMDLRYDAAASERAEDAETSYLPPPLALEALSLGRPAFVADMVFIRANLYFIGHLFTDRIFKWLDLYVETMLALDESNPRVYEWASQAVKYGQLISNDVLERSNHYAEQGIERFPDAWQLYFDIGFNYYLEWKVDSPAERDRMREKALPYFSVAAALPGSELDPNFVTELYLQESDVEMALFHAYLRYWEANEREKAALRERITAYESQAASERLEATEARWKDEFPYVPFSLFALLGPDHDLRVPTSWADPSAVVAAQAPTVPDAPPVEVP
ncbi:MAG: hypothetical protein H6746_03420 [Deltaproteobacteria bacterium]|nr:hypothetical protein [Deltaproteobacteria bacterium]